MIPDVSLKTSLLGGGFEKKSAEECFQKLIAHLNNLESDAGFPLTKFDSAMLKKTAFGQGYEKTSVLTYIDSLNQRILELEEIIKK